MLIDFDLLQIGLSYQNINDIQMTRMNRVSSFADSLYTYNEINCMKLRHLTDKGQQGFNNNMSMLAVKIKCETKKFIVA